MSDRKSKVQDHFKRVKDDPKKVTFKICRQTFSYYLSASNMADLFKHLSHLMYIAFPILSEVWMWMSCSIHFCNVFPQKGWPDFPYTRLFLLSCWQVNVTQGRQLLCTQHCRLAICFSACNSHAKKHLNSRLLCQIRCVLVCLVRQAGSSLLHLKQESPSSLECCQESHGGTLIAHQCQCFGFRDNIQGQCAG